MDAAVSAARSSTRDRPIAIAVLAMGGQGGGVLADWIVALAEGQGWFAQSTSVPGVAQRTGATIYYIEMLSQSDGSGRRPVLSLMPAPGEVDIVIGAELMEAGRAILRGLVTPDRTTLIASSHRAYAVSEKNAPGDGIGDPGQGPRSGARGAAKQFHRLRHGGARRAVGQRDLGRPCSARWRPPAPCRSPREAYEATIRARAAWASRRACAPLRAPTSGRGGTQAPTPAPRCQRRRQSSFPTLRPIGDAGFDALVERMRAICPAGARHGRGRPGARRRFPGRRPTGDEYLDPRRQPSLRGCRRSTSSRSAAAKQIARRHGL